MKEKDIALVFAGGGGKGAFEVGVWNALEEYGLAENIKAVAGTSVGALNAALFVQGDLYTAEKIWRDISTDKILTINPQKTLDFLSNYISIKENIIRNVFSLSKHGIFTRDGLREIIEENINLTYISQADISFYATAFNIRQRKAEYFKVNGCSKEKIISILLASSALPFIFPSEKIDGKRYLDGGMPFAGDNLPIKPLYDSGCKIIFVVHLSQTHIIDRVKYPDAQIIEIVPQLYQGGAFSGTLDFTPEGARRRINQGYRDTKIILEPLYRTANTQAELLEKLYILKNTERNFYRKRKAMKRKREREKALLKKGAGFYG